MRGERLPAPRQIDDLRTACLEKLLDVVFCSQLDVLIPPLEPVCPELENFSLVLIVALKKTGDVLVDS